MVFVDDNITLLRNHCQPEPVFICRCVNSCGFKRWCKFPPLAAVWNSLRMKAQKQRVQADVAQNSQRNFLITQNDSVLTKVAAILDREHGGRVHIPPTFRSLVPISETAVSDDVGGHELGKSDC